MSDTKDDKATDRRVERKLRSLVQEITNGIREHDKQTAALLKMVEGRLALLAQMEKALRNINAVLGDVSVDIETEKMLHKLMDDLKAHQRLTASMRVPLQRAPSLKNYSLMAEGT